MKPTMVFVSAACALAFSFTSPGKALATAPSCAERITRATVVPCALLASLGARAEELGLESLEGRRTAAGLLLPSNPTLSLTGGYPVEPSLTEHPPLWSAALSQEVEIAGQRGARLGLVSAEQRAQQGRVLAARRAAAVSALNAYFDALAALEEARITDRLMAVSTALKNVAGARAQLGLASDVDARLAEAASTRLAQAHLEAQERVATTSAMLATLTGGDPAGTRPLLEGELLPLAIVDAPASALVEAALARRADVAIAAAERDAQEKRASVFERVRVPNPTFSVFARKDWIGEQSIGVGVSFPISLPAPVGRTYAGEIAEATTLARRSETDEARVRRTVRLEVVQATEIAASRKLQVALYTPDHVKKTEAALVSIAEELEARRLPIREALFTQQALVDFLAAYLAARRALCTASVELARAAGLPLERGAQ